MSPRSIRSLLVALLLVPSVARPAAEIFVLAKTGAPPPAVALPVRLAVAAEGLQIEHGGSRLATFWLRRDLPVGALPREGASPVLAEGIVFPRVSAATLLGVVSFVRPWLDYRKRELPAGIYTMRYAVQPAMKEHKGVSRYRDFAILTPVVLDPDLERNLAETIAASTRAFAWGHPAVLAIFPFSGALSDPKIAENELGQPVLAARLGPIAMGFALQGHGMTDGPS
jgi:hypothetical protein